MSTLYEKTGRRYLPVHDTRALDGLSNGSWLVTVEKGHWRIRKAVDDQRGLEVLAACSRWLEDIIAREVETKSQSRHGNGGPISIREQKAAKAYRKVMGDDKYLIWFTRPSSCEVAREVVREIVRKVQEDASVQEGAPLAQRIDDVLAGEFGELDSVLGLLERLDRRQKVDPSEIRQAIETVEKLSKDRRKAVERPSKDGHGESTT